MIIGIHGKIGSGKSTLTQKLVSGLNENGILAEERYFAKVLKEMHELLTGYAGYTQEEKNIYMDEYGFTVGEGLQKIGDGLRATYDKDVWLKAAMKDLIPGEVYIFSDVRYPNEANEIKQKGGILIKLTGDPANVRKESKRDTNHSSEIALDNYNGFDYIFDNSGNILKLKEFANEVIDIVKSKTENEYMNES
jgi:hypothetical protein